ncbi:MAG TPA: ferredoxin:protochlorophyllide reductase (ATP-dependent) subunit B [Roseiflexaceae bacterium]|nr:ferredoxin:protochlorophyllide reductase (ATP-dependent) subunit B [Roseiflexaceae bacterium]
MRLALWMYEGTAHHGVGRIANSLRGVHAVFHAPQGDDYVNPIFTMLERTPAFPQLTTSVVSGRDLAQGTIRLPETLRQVEAKLHPELIVVCASCSTILLQEDLQTVADSARTEAEVLVYDANPYRMQEVLSAEGLLTVLIKRYARPQPLTARPSVNIIGPASLGFHVRTDLICLRRIMQTLGVDLNVVAPLGAGLDDLARLPAAWVNIAPYRELGLGAARFLEEQFGTPTLYDAPIGVQPTLRWLRRLVDLLNEVGARAGTPALRMPPLTAFSLDGMSAPSGVPWFARTADMESFSSKSAFVFGDATHTVGMVKFLRDELALNIAGAGTYLLHEADWVRGELQGYLPDDLLVTDRFQEVAARITDLRPELVCGTQMERHSCRKFDLPCMVIAPPTHIENHLLGYRPVLGFDGADVLADEVYTTATLGMEKHLIDLFGDAGLDYEAPAHAEAAPPASATDAPEPAPEAALAGAAPTAAPGALTPVWTAEAQAMLKKIPFFVRGRVQRNVEKYAGQHGHASITVDVLQTAKEALGG